MPDADKIAAVFVTDTHTGAHTDTQTGQKNKIPRHMNVIAFWFVLTWSERSQRSSSHSTQLQSICFPDLYYLDQKF